MKKYIKILPVVFASLLIIGGTVYAAFPAQLNNFVAGNVIRSADWNAIEADLGTHVGPVATGTPETVNWIIRNAMFATGTLRIGGSATTTIAGNTGSSTFVNGISLNAGCFAYGSTCITQAAGTVTSIATTYPVQGGTITTTGTISLAFGTTTANTWGAGNIFLASTTAQYFNSASSTIDVLAVPSLTSALLLTNGNGVFAEYAGTSCTNQFVRSLSALGAATCATVGTADVSGLDISDDTNLAVTYPVVLTGDTLSLAFGTSTANTWTANTQTFGTIAGAIDAGGATSFEIPNGTAPTVDATGEVALDTTSDQLVAFGATAKKVYGNGYTYRKFSIATTTGWVATTTRRLGIAMVGETWDQVICETSAGTLNVDFGDGTNFTPLLNASTTKGTFTLSSNNTFTAGETQYFRAGTPASSPTELACVVRTALTAD